MKQRPFQTGPWCRRLLYALSLTLFLTGISWAWIQHLDQEGRASDTLLQIKTKLIAVHGLSAIFFVLLLGTLLVTHVQRAWLGRKNRPNGALFLTAVSLLTLSGYALYYLSVESIRAAAGRLHLWLGVGAPLLLLWHIWCGRTAVIRREKDRPGRVNSQPVELGSFQSSRQWGSNRRQPECSRK
jgi:hypothetical protein